MTRSNTVVEELLAQAIIRNGLVRFAPVEVSKIKGGCVALGLCTTDGTLHRLMGENEPKLDLKKAGITVRGKSPAEIIQEVREYLADKPVQLSVAKPIDRDFLFRVWSGLDFLDAIIPSANLGILEVKASLPFSSHRVTEKDIERVDESMQTMLNNCTVSIDLKAVALIPGLDLDQQFLIGRKPLLNLIAPADSQEGKALSMYKLLYSSISEERRMYEASAVLKKFWCPPFLVKWIVGTRNICGNPDQLTDEFAQMCATVLKLA